MNPKLLIGIVLFTLVVAGQPARAGSYSETIEYVRPRMVKIFGAGGLRRLYGYGTGFLISSRGHIATVWSHVLDSETVTVVLDDGRKYEAKVIGAEPQLDLAVLKIDGEDFLHFDLEQAVSAGPGTRILAFSNMFKVATGDEPVTVLQGVIAAKTKLSARRGAFQMPYEGPVYIVDAITNNPGSGGGVLATRDGKLLAMVGKELRNTASNSWINYAVPIAELKDVIGQIISGNFSRKPNEKREQNPNRYVSLDFGIVLVPDVLYRTPAFVDSVVAGSAAQQAGLRPDDLVMFVNDQLVQSCRMCSEELGLLEAGDTLRVVVRRGDSLLTFEFPVPRKKENE